MTTIKAHFDGRTFVPDEAVNMPANSPVTVHADTAEPVTAAEIEKQLKALDELDKLARDTGTHEVDWSRERIYSGTLDDPR